MSEEQMRILEMLADHKITAEQAEALLAALGEDRNPLATLSQEAMEKIGKVVGGISRGIGAPWSGGNDETDDGATEVGPEGIELPEDAELVVRVKGCSVRIHRVDGTRTAMVTSSGTRKPMVRLDGKTCFLTGGGRRTGDIDVACPAIGALAVKMMGGSAAVEGLDARIRAKVHGGEFRAVRCSGPFDLKCFGGNLTVDGEMTAVNAKCMGGEMRLGRLCVSEGRHRVGVMGGSVKLGLDPACSVLVRTQVFGGAVNTDLACVCEPSGLAKRRAEYRMGAGDAVLDVKAMGGDISIKQAAASEATAAATGETE